MAAGSGIGPAREAMMLKGIVTWARVNKHMRPVEVGGVDLIVTLSQFHRAISNGEVEDRQILMAHRYLCLFVEELQEVLND